MPSLEVLENRNLLSGISWNTRDYPNGGPWDSADAWFDDQGQHRLPTNADNVSIGLSPAAVVTISSSANADSLSSGATLQITGGAAYFVTASFDSPVQLLGGVAYFANATFNNTFEFLGGTLSGITITNNSDITIDGTDPKQLQVSLFVNNGTIRQTGTGDLFVQGDFENNTLYDMQADARIWGGIITNTGNFGKSSGSGTANVDARFNNVGGNISVINGTLGFSGGGLWANTQVTVTSASHLFLSSLAGDLQFSGNFVGLDGGEVRLESGRTSIGDSGATFNFPPGMLRWTAGDLVESSATSTLTNQNTITLSGGETKRLRVKLVNPVGSTMVQTDSGNLVVYRELDNQGTYDLQSGASIVYAGDVLRNSGVFRKSGGGLSVFNSFASTASGSVDVQSGTLRLSFAAASTGANFNVNPGAHVDLVDGEGGLTGTYAGTGGGEVEVRIEAGRLSGGPAGLTLGFAPGMLRWTRGIIDATGSSVTNTGTLTLAGPDYKSLDGTLINQGTIIQKDSGEWYGQLLDNRSTGTYEMQSETALSTGRISNAGRLLKSGGAPTTISIPVDNLSGGRIEVTNGQLRLSGGGNFSGGTFSVADPAAILHFPASSGTLTFGNSFTGSGNGQVWLDRDLTLSADIPQFRFAQGLFHWKSGSISGGDLFNLEGSTITLSRDTVKRLVNATLNNQGDILHQGGILDLSNNGHVDNRHVYLFDSGEIRGGAADAFRNTGTLGTTDAADTSSGTISLPFTNDGYVILLPGAHRLEFQSSFTNASTVIVGRGSEVHVIGTFAQTRGETRMAGTLSVTNLLDIQGGRLTGLGFLVGNVRNAAEITLLEQYTGTLLVTGTYEQTTTGVLNIEIGGRADYDSLAVRGQATLAGTVRITLINGFRPDPDAPDRFQIVTYGSHSGEFERHVGLDIGGGLVFAVDYLADSLTLTTFRGGGDSPAPRASRDGNGLPLAVPVRCSDRETGLLSPSPVDADRTPRNRLEAISRLFAMSIDKNQDHRLDLFFWWRTMAQDPAFSESDPIVR